MSKKLKDTIVDSIKIAASKKKQQASVEDFVLALIKGSVPWLLNFCSFV